MDMTRAHRKKHRSRSPGQEFGRGCAFGLRCLAAVFDSHADGDQGIGAQQGVTLGHREVS